MICVQISDMICKVSQIAERFQLRVDDIAGSIEVGKSAKYNVYGLDLFEVPEDEFQYVLPELAVFEGRAIEGTTKQD